MISSMTGFARVAQETEWGVLTWEVRSVNHRFLEVFTRLPDFLKRFDVDVRACVKKWLGRGKVDVTLSFTPNASTGLPEIDEAVLLSLSDLYARIDADFPNVTTNPADVLKAEGVVVKKMVEAEALSSPMFESLDSVLSQLVHARQQEGFALQGILVKATENLMAEVTSVLAHLPDVLSRERSRVQARAKELSVSLEPERLEQEMVYLAQKSDVAEELQRLTVHVGEVARVLEKGGVVGRRLDFLIQELNREANTIASKSLCVETTQSSVEMKVLIEQMREQVQNIE